MDYFIKGFGALDLAAPATLYEHFFEWQGRTVDMDMVLSGEPVTEELMNKVELLVARKEELERKSRELLEAQTMRDNGGVMADFTTILLDYLQHKLHPRVVDEQDPTPPHIQVSRKIEWKSIRFEPEDESSFVMYKYGLAGSRNPKSINIYYNSKGELDTILVI